MGDKRTRRANGDGSITSRETKTKGLVWDVQLSLKDRNTGLVDRVTKRGFRTQKEAMDWRSRKMRESSLKLYTKPKAVMLPDLCRRYIDEHPKLAPSTRENYERALRLHIRPALNARAEAVSARDLEKFAAEGPGPTARTVAVVVVRAAVHWASDPDVGLLPHNHLAKRRVRMPATQGKATAIPAHTLARIITSANSDQSRLAWLVGSHAGPRRGEMIALKWRDWDFTRSRIWFGAIATPESDGREIVERTKGRRGRWVPVSGAVTREAQKLKLSRGALDEDPIFVTEKGKRKGLPWSFAAIQSRWEVDTKRAGVSGYHIHELRHTYATSGLESGKSVQTMSKLLGHANPAITARIYAHVIDGSEELVADAVAMNLGIVDSSALDPIAPKTASGGGVTPLFPRKSAEGQG